MEPNHVLSSALSSFGLELETGGNSCRLSDAHLLPSRSKSCVSPNANPYPNPLFAFAIAMLYDNLSTPDPSVPLCPLEWRDLGYQLQMLKNPDRLNPATTVLKKSDRPLSLSTASSVTTNMVTHEHSLAPVLTPIFTPPSAV